tara:strand:+ start:182 stop:496 length:315 start_codon:yes stop_codon:yes gene_type:complete
MIPNQEKNQFKKGESGNPNGRPRKLPELDKLLADVLGEEKDGVSAAEAILKALRLKASKGDVRAIELMLDRAYGKAPQTITHEGLPTSVTFNFTDMSGDKTDEE